MSDQQPEEPSGVGQPLAQVPPPPGSPRAPIDNDHVMHTDEEAIHADDELTPEGGTDSPPPLTDGETHDDQDAGLHSNSDDDSDGTSHSSSEDQSDDDESMHSDSHPDSGEDSDECPNTFTQIDRSHLTPTPSPKPKIMTKLGKEVADLVDEAQIETMVPALANFYSVNRLPLIQVLDRHIQLILDRSPVFKDAQVTIYDKALLRLTKNGTNLDQPSAIQFFCEHFLGLKVEGDPAYGFDILNQVVRLQSVLRTELSSPAAPSSGDATAVEHHPTTTSTVQDPKPEREPRNLERLRDVYEKAKNDFYSELNRPGRDDRDAHAAAMFLRDTAENLLTLLSGQSVDETYLEELNATYTMAKAMVVSLVGGRKRKFDPVPDDAGIPTGPSGTRAGHSGSYNDNTGANENRGRSRTQTQGGGPQDFRRDGGRDDERYSFEDPRSSFDERHARDDRSEPPTRRQRRTNVNNPAHYRDWTGRLDELLPSERGHYHRYDGLAMNEGQQGGQNQNSSGTGQWFPGTWVTGGRGFDSYRPDSRS